MKKVVWSRKFKKDYQLAIKRGLSISKLDYVITTLANDKPLDEKYHDHELVGEFYGFRECHIEPDWLLIYMISTDKLILSLIRTGTHSDLF